VEEEERKVREEKEEKERVVMEKEREEKKEKERAEKEEKKAEREKEKAKKGATKGKGKGKARASPSPAPAASDDDDEAMDIDEAAPSKPAPSAAKSKKRNALLAGLDDTPAPPSRTRGAASTPAATSTPVPTAKGRSKTPAVTAKKEKEKKDDKPKPSVSTVLVPKGGRTKTLAQEMALAAAANPKLRELGTEEIGKAEIFSHFETGCVFPSLSSSPSLLRRGQVLMKDMPQRTGGFFPKVLVDVPARFLLRTSHPSLQPPNSPLLLLLPLRKQRRHRRRSLLSPLHLPQRSRRPCQNRNRSRSNRFRLLLLLFHLNPSSETPLAVRSLLLHLPLPPPPLPPRRQNPLRPPPRRRTKAKQKPKSPPKSSPTFPPPPPTATSTLTRWPSTLLLPPPQRRRPPTSLLSNPPTPVVSVRTPTRQSKPGRRSSPISIRSSRLRRMRSWRMDIWFGGGWTVILGGLVRFLPFFFPSLPSLLPFEENEADEGSVRRQAKSSTPKRTTLLPVLDRKNVRRTGKRKSRFISSARSGRRTSLPFPPPSRVSLPSPPLPFPANSPTDSQILAHPRQSPQVRRERRVRSTDVGAGAYQVCQ